MNDLLRDLLFLPPQASTVAGEIDALHYFVIGVTMLGAAAVGTTAVLFVIRFRRGRVRNEGRLGGGVPVRVEVFLIALLVVLFLAWWRIGVSQYMRLRVPPADALRVWVDAKQWRWRFTHADGRSEVGTLRVPSGRPVELVMTSRDVIHSFFVPAFRIKQDVVPGLYTTAWFQADVPGTYDIYCTEFCGTAHSTMLAKVEVLEPAAYASWLADAPAFETAGPTSAVPALPQDEARAQPTTLAAQGVRIAAQHGCLRCHTTDGSRHIGPSFAGLVGTRVPLTDGREVLVDEAYLTESMMDPLAAVHAGYEPVMPPYQGLLEPAEVAALVELVRELRDVEPGSALPDDFRVYPPPRAVGEPRYPAPTASPPVKEPP